MALGPADDVIPKNSITEVQRDNEIPGIMPAALRTSIAASTLYMLRKLELAG